MLCNRSTAGNTNPLLAVLVAILEETSKDIYVETIKVVRHIDICCLICSNRTFYQAITEFTNEFLLDRRSAFLFSAIVEEILLDDCHGIIRAACNEVDEELAVQLIALECVDDEASAVAAEATQEDSLKRLSDIRSTDRRILDGILCCAVLSIL